MAKRISHKNVGEIFKVRFTGETTDKECFEEHMLIGYHSPTGDRKDDTADFREVLDCENLQVKLAALPWTAYRSNGRWVYGSSADVLVVVD